MFTKEFLLVWRNMERTTGSSDSCPRMFPSDVNTTSTSSTLPDIKEPQVAAATFTTYAWVYEYTF